MPASANTLDKPRVYLVQVLASVEVLAPNKHEAKRLALVEMLKRCEQGQQLTVHAEEVRP